MSEDFSDDFIIEEEEEGANRTFLIIAGSLVGIFILIIGCVLLYAFLNRGGNANEIAEIETANAQTAIENARVTQTIIAMNLTNEAPTQTFTPSPSPPATNTPTATSSPTGTSVVQTPGTGEPETGDGTGDGTVTVTPNLAGTQIFGGDGGAFNTPTPISGTGAGGTGTGTGTLPQTGVTTVGAVVVGLLLVAVLAVARRLRTG
jgi:LPXTG-motif cell wall-anchored protein